MLEIPFAEVLNIFDGIYLSWDPKIWKNVIDFHGYRISPCIAKMKKAHVYLACGKETKTTTMVRMDFSNTLSLHKYFPGFRQMQIEFNNASPADEEVWILLTRHIVDSSRKSEFISLQVELEDELWQSTNATDNQRNLSARV